VGREDVVSLTKFTKRGGGRETDSIPRYARGYIKRVIVRHPRVPKKKEKKEIRVIYIMGKKRGKKEIKYGGS